MSSPRIVRVRVNDQEGEAMQAEETRQCVAAFVEWWEESADFVAHCLKMQRGSWFVDAHDDVDKGFRGWMTDKEFRARCEILEEHKP